MTENPADANPLSALATETAQQLLAQLNEQHSDPAFVLLASQFNAQDAPDITFATVDPLLTSLLKLLVDGFSALPTRNRVSMALVLAGFNTSVITQSTLSQARKDKAKQLLGTVQTYLEQEYAALNHTPQQA
jgi:hypothetical protein